MLEDQPLIETARWRGVYSIGAGISGIVQVVEGRGAEGPDAESSTSGDGGAAEGECAAAANPASKDITANKEQFCAAKILDPDATVQVDEVVRHSELRHGHIIRFVEVVPLFERQSRKLCVVTELAERGNMWGMLSEAPPEASLMQRAGAPSSWGLYPLTEQCGRWVVQQVVLALEYMHAKGVHTRDLKPQNVLVTRWTLRHPTRGGASVPLAPVVKLSTFTYARSDECAGTAVSMVASDCFTTPEALLSEMAPFDGRKADVWGAGVLLFVLLTGELPFATPADVVVGARGAASCAARLAVRERVLRGELVAPARAARACLSAGVQALLERLLARNAEARPDMAEMLHDAWLTLKMPPAARAWQALRLEEAAASSPGAMAEGDSLRDHIEALLAAIRSRD